MIDISVISISTKNDDNSFNSAISTSYILLLLYFSFRNYVNGDKREIIRGCKCIYPSYSLLYHFTTFWGRLQLYWNDTTIHVFTLVLHCRP